MNLPGRFPPVGMMPPMNYQPTFQPQQQQAPSYNPNSLPPGILALFTPRPPLEYMPPVEKKDQPPYTGVAQYVQFFETQEDHDRLTTPYEIPPSRRVKREKAEKDKKERGEAKIREQLKKWDPQNDPNITSDSRNTIFITKLNYATTEEKLMQEFSEYGPIKSCRIVREPDGKSRGYAFVEYENPTDATEAYKQGDARNIDGFRVMVDVERGRTVRNWRPRRLGGGIGNSRATKLKADVIRAQREQPAPYSGGGGYRGGGGRDGGGYNSYNRSNDRPAPYQQRSSGGGGYNNDRNRSGIGYRGGSGGGSGGGYRDRNDDRGNGSGYNDRRGGGGGGYNNRRTSDDFDDRRGSKRSREY